MHQCQGFHDNVEVEVKLISPVNHSYTEAVRLYLLTPVARVNRSLIKMTSSCFHSSNIYVLFLRLVFSKRYISALLMRPLPFKTIRGEGLLLDRQTLISHKSEQKQTSHFSQWPSALTALKSLTDFVGYNSIRRLCFNPWPFIPRGFKEILLNWFKLNLDEEYINVSEKCKFILINSGSEVIRLHNHLWTWVIGSQNTFRCSRQLIYKQPINTLM